MPCVVLQVDQPIALFVLIFLLKVYQLEILSYHATLILYQLRNRVLIFYHPLYLICMLYQRVICSQIDTCVVMLVALSILHRAVSIFGLLHVFCEIILVLLRLGTIQKFDFSGWCVISVVFDLIPMVPCWCCRCRVLDLLLGMSSCLLLHKFLHMNKLLLILKVLSLLTITYSINKYLIQS